VHALWSCAFALAFGCGGTQGQMRAAAGQQHQSHAHQRSTTLQASDAAEGEGREVDPTFADSLVSTPAAADPAFSQGPFTGSGACSMCHDGIVDRAGHDVSIVEAWSSTMMANATRDPLWRAKVESELPRNPEHAELVADKCTRCHAPMAHELSRLAGQSLALQHGGIEQTSPYYTAAADGVSCTLCHQIQDTNLGAANSFDGSFRIGCSSRTAPEELSDSDRLQHRA
jgi:hypothetical protein